MTALNALSAIEMRRGYLNRDFSPTEVLQAVTARVEDTRRFNAFITPTLESALREAREAERLYLSGHAAPLPLLGIPVAVKDNFDTQEIPTTYGSGMFEGHHPNRTAACVRRIHAAGGVVIGKTNLHEFAWGITGVNPHFGPCHNPWRFDRMTGGSSSGSAAAVALMTAPVALGSDTAGSTRIPAGFCGVVGFKPSRGRISRDGLFPLAPSLDSVGLLARQPADLALALEVLAPPASSRRSEPNDMAQSVQQQETLRGVRIGVIGVSPVSPLDPVVSRVFKEALDTLQSLGANVVELDSHTLDHVLDVFTPLQRAEALAVHGQRGLFPSREHEYGDDVRLHLQEARKVSSADYLRRALERERLVDRVQLTFEDVDLMASPLAPSGPAAITSLSDADTAAVVRRQVLPYTVPQSLLGIPCCVLRAGFDCNGLPVGLQMSAPQAADDYLLKVAQIYYEATSGVQDRWPDVVE
jgi:aspartyl-tRNA(Asn)/glutamyl-tRNA(Gln) amidotransferase subunit A